MPRIFISELTSLLKNRIAFVLTHAMNKQQQSRAMLPHSHSGWELVINSKGVKLNPPGMIHDDIRSDGLSIEVNLRKISCTSYGNGTTMTYFTSDDLSTFHLAPELFGILQKVYPVQPLSENIFYTAISSLIYILKHVSPERESYTQQEVAKRVISYLNTHYYQNDLSLEALSDIFGTSPQYLNRVLHKYSYPSIHTALLEIRLLKARELFDHGNHQVADVAYRTGWTSPFYFSSRFRRKFGISPRNYIIKVINTPPGRRKKNVRNLVPLFTPED